MISFKTSTGSLELDAGTQVQIEKTSPFMQLDGELVGDYSLPFNVKATNNNMVQLGFDPLLHKKLTDAGQPAKFLDDNTYISSGTIKVESIEHYINDVKKSNISCYYLSSSAAFYQQVKGVKLKDINLGGDRSFTWDSFNVFGAGFWGHIHAVLNGAPGYTIGAYDYAFYSVYDALATVDELGDPAPQVLNNMEYSGGALKFKHGAYTGLNGATADQTPNIIVPFPYLAYVLKQAAAYAGWTVEGSALVEFDFLRATMINFLSIRWGYTQASGGLHIEGQPIIAFNLNRHMPDMTIGEFLTAIKTRFGFFYDFDNARKIIYVNTYADLQNGAVKDMTSKTVMPLKKNIVNNAAIYAFNMAETTYLTDNKGELVADNIQGQVELLADLPTAAATNESDVYLVTSLAAYYICTLTDVEVYEWVYLRWHIYEVEPAGFTNTINTAALITGNKYLNAYYDFLPYYDLEIKENTSGNLNPGPLLLAYWCGQKNNKSGQLTAFATSGVYDSNNNLIATLGLAWICLKSDGTDVGIIAQRYQPLFDLLSDYETFDLQLLLSRLDIINLRFTDQLTINGVRMIIKDMQPVYPYNGMMAIKCIRKK